MHDSEYSRHRFFQVSLGLVFATLVWMSASQRPEAKEQSMEVNCENIVRDTSLIVDLQAKQNGGRVIVRFKNNSMVPLWLPVENEPSFRPDRENGLLTVWLGYFEEVYGEYSGQYMVPKLMAVRPGEEVPLELTSRQLTETLFSENLAIQVKARVSTVELEHSRVRGEQPLERYIQHSCLIGSPAFAIAE